MTKTKKPKQQPKRGVGRPLAIIADEKTFREIEALAKIQCTQAEAASVLGVSRSTLDLFFKANPKARAKWDMGPGVGRASLRRNQFKLSESNATMCIWLGKQYLDQKDHQRFEHTGKDGGPIETTDTRDMARAVLEILSMAEIEDSTGHTVN